jgi:hypothetical protein
MGSDRNFSISVGYAVLLTIFCRTISASGGIELTSNVDDKDILEGIVNFLINEVCNRETLIWPIHPRTRKQLEVFDLWELVAGNENIILLAPIKLASFSLQIGAR